jgi:transcriptional regulator with GAF, ATPase, and Fis domain
VNPRLAVVAGPLKESTLALPDREIPIGRDPSNLISISDPSLSRRHCVLTPARNGYTIRDLDSRNGTFVNGLVVKEATLKHGDQISVGDSVLTFLLEDEEDHPSSGRVEFEDSVTHATAQLRPQDVLYLQPELILNELPVASRLGRNLAALLKISRMVHALHNLEELQEQILNSIFEVVPAERGAILLDGKGGGQFGSVFARHRQSGITLPVRVSTTISKQVMEQGVAILGADVASSGDLRGVDSIVSLNVRSLLCVPLPAFDRVIGCIYLDTTSLSNRFDEENLQLVAGIAAISAVALDNARRLQWLEQENLRLTTEINVDHNMVGESQRMKEIYQFLSRVAPADSTVLIEGESGTGKELAARAIHRNSSRSAKPFVTINCAAIPEGLLESELFGHEKGSFTGAVAQKKGRLEVAEGGTVFLDEIGDMAPALQVKLLRVLQEREFERVGGTRSIAVDVRVIAATNRDLRETVRGGGFRQDLYYRLNVVSLTLPSLRERREDVPMLAEYFVVKCAKKCKVRPRRVSPQAMACLLNYDWPGNVRELENAIERALVLSLTDEIRPEDLPESVLEKGAGEEGGPGQYHAAVISLKKKLILDAIDQAKGSYTEGARILGVHPNYLHRLIRNLDLKDHLRSSTTTRSGRTIGNKF